MVNWHNMKRYAMYENFHIAGEDDGYRLHVGNYSGTAGIVHIFQK